MTLLLDASFASGLPEHWFEEDRHIRFEDGSMRMGPSAHFCFPLPAGAWETLRIEFEVEPFGDNHFICDDGTVYLHVDLQHGHHRISGYGPGADLARNHLPVEKASAARHTISFEFDRSRLRALVDGREIIAAEDPEPIPAEGWFHLQTWGDGRMHRVRILADHVVAEVTIPPPPSDPSDLHLEVCVDFYDDLLHGAWTLDMFNQLFAELRSWGVRRCHWIYYGSSQNGWLHTAPEPVGANARRTIENVGEIFPVVVRVAHAHDIKIHALFRCFDVGLYRTSAAAAAHGRLSRIGGSILSIADFPAARRDLIMARKPSLVGPAAPGPFTCIDLVKEDQAPSDFDIADVRLWISDDNQTYRLYDGPLTRENVLTDYPVWEHTASGGRPTGAIRSVRVMRFANLAICENFVALSIGSNGRSFSNSLINLIHVFNERGEERQLSYGVVPRTADFTADGIEFDVASTAIRGTGTPSAVFPDFDGIRARRTFDSGHGFIGIARGKNDGAVCALSPSFPETRAWWISMVREALDAGADGLEMRVRNHHAPMAWGELGFEAPVRDAFLQRHGVDLWATDDFNKADWRRLRGEAYTEFYREVKALAASRGSVLGLHISPTLDMDPRRGGAMEIHWDWRRWLAEGLADSITLKEVWPGSRLAREVLTLARTKKIPVTFSPYANTLWSRPGGEQVVKNRIELARSCGCQGFQFYECAAIVKTAPDGVVRMAQPQLRELFRREFLRGPSA